MSRSVKIVIVCLGIVLAAGLAAGVYVHMWNSSPLQLTEPTVVQLAPGEPFQSFAERLGQRGIVVHHRLWSRLANLRGLARRAKAGEYRIEPGDTPEAVLDRLVRGAVVIYQTQIIEGWTVMQAVASLGAHDKLTHELRGVNVLTLLDTLGLPGGHAEGLFFPDTYHFVRGDSDADILRRAYAKLQQVLRDQWANRDPEVVYQTPYEALIVASLIEKETGRDEDREHISQVFNSRLQLGMRLQTDPSVIYGLGVRFTGNLSRRHLREDTPYNTYVHRGLPPTPIALAGAKSIRAALHPGPGSYLYFVSRGDGSSYFSTSLAEHRAAVRKYQLQ